jgi:stage V sporulation protein R
MPKSLSPRLMDLKVEIEGFAREYGLDFFETVFEVLTYDELNMVASYGGFPNRYPHWRWGMEYESLSKGYEYGLSKIYELVINNNPCYAYLLESNAEVDQKLVMAHVYGHCDFFKNNFSFAHTNRRMIDEMANHGTRVRRWVDKIGVDKVEDFIDRALSLENLIDQHAPHIRRNPDPKRAAEEAKSNERVEGFKVDREYMRGFVNPTEFLESERKKVALEKVKAKGFPERPQRDVLNFLLENAPMEDWELDVLAILREEAYYFAPQGQTKIMNEGWACLAGDMLAFSGAGLLPMSELVAGKASEVVSDGDRRRGICDRHVIRDHETVTVTTRRGIKLTGSTNHRVLLDDKASWKRLDDLGPGDRVAISGGAGLWPKGQFALEWKPAQRVGLAEVAERAEVSLSTVLRHRAGRNVRSRGSVAYALEAYDAAENLALPQALGKRAAVAIPSVLDERLGAFLGYLVGDGHISRVKRNLGLTTGDAEQAHAFAQLSRSLFGLSASVRRDGGRLRVLLHSEMLSDFLVEALGLTTGPSARDKAVPAAVLRSPEPVVRAFLRAYFDCDGHAGKQGVILSTTSDALATQVQLLLFNYGILSRKRRQTDGCWHLHVTGASAAEFAKKVGFGLRRKQRALEAYVSRRRWFKAERWDDEVVSVERGRADVYDLSVEETHRYAAAGLVNHNSFWHSKIMTTRALKDHEIIDYADHHSGTMGTRPGSLNPYKLGIELYRDIEDRWNKGRFGKEWDECDDLRARRVWDKKLGTGREKIFEVRKHYNDITFIDTFLTAEFAIDQKLFVYGYNDKRNSWEILDREFRKVKSKLLHQLTNFGQPIIEVVEANGENRGELVVAHRHDGQDLKSDYAKETLKNLQSLWRRPVSIVTKVEGKGVMLRFDGKEHSEKKVEL